MKKQFELAQVETGEFNAVAKLARKENRIESYGGDFIKDDAKMVKYKAELKGFEKYVRPVPSFSSSFNTIWDDINNQARFLGKDIKKINADKNEISSLVQTYKAKFLDERQKIFGVSSLLLPEFNTMKTLFQNIHNLNMVMQDLFIPRLNQNEVVKGKSEQSRRTRNVTEEELVEARKLIPQKK